MIESTKTCCSHVILLYANILISLKITSPHLISPRLTSPHLTLSSHHNSSHLASSHFTSTHRNPLPLTPPHLTPPYLISSQLASPDHLTLISPQLIKLTSNSSVLTLSYFSSSQVVLGSAVLKLSARAQYDQICCRLYHLEIEKKKHVSKSQEHNAVSGKRSIER